MISLVQKCTKLNYFKSSFEKNVYMLDVKIENNYI